MPSITEETDNDDEADGPPTTSACSKAPTSSANLAAYKGARPTAEDPFNPLVPSAALESVRWCWQSLMTPATHDATPDGDVYAPTRICT
jgi:hypothetical protein